MTKRRPNQKVVSLFELTEDEVKQLIEEQNLICEIYEQDDQELKNYLL